MLRKHLLLPTLLSVGLGLGLLSCGSGDEYETVVVPTEGLITTVKEVNAGDFKIESEVPVDQLADSRIVVNTLKGSSDTFTLEEAQLIQQIMPDTARQNRPFRTAGLGFWGYMMLGRMGGHTPSAGAYVNNDAYNRANNNAGSRLRSSGKSVTRAKSGFGGGKSSRSFGG